MFKDSLKNFPKFQRLRVIGFSLVLVLVPFIVYYYFWISNQTKYFTGRDLRVLGALRSHVEDSVANQLSVFENGVNKFLDDLANPATEGESEKETEPVGAQQLKDQEDQYKREFQRKILDPLKGDGTNLTATSFQVVSEPQDTASLPTKQMEIRLEDNERWLYLDYTTKYRPRLNSYFLDPISGPEGKSGSWTYLNFKVKTNLHDLIGPFVSKRGLQAEAASNGNGDFDAILIADLGDQVNTIFQSSEHLRVASLNNLTSAIDYKPIDLKNYSQSTNILDVTLAGTDYKLFLQPIELPLAKVGDNKQHVRWLACGFVEGGHFRRASWSVSYTVLIVFGFITVLVLLSWPFLKLIFIGPKDRFRAVDAYLLVLSALVITGLLTFFVCFSYSYIKDENVLDSQLEAFAGNVQQNFNHEIAVALEQVDQLNCHPALLTTLSRIDRIDRSDPLVVFSLPTILKYEYSSLDGVDVGKRICKYQTTGAAQSELPLSVAELRRQYGRERYKGSILIRELSEKENKSPNAYPYFLSAFWADFRGQQRIKWSVRSRVTNSINISGRPYFSKLHQRLHDTYNGHEFLLEHIVNKTTGQNEVIVAKPILPFASNVMWIAGINTKLLSLMQPVVPSGFGFAVIDETGEVFFHSDDKKHSGENFLEECDNNQTLRAAVLGRSAQSMNATYLGKGHSLFVRPLENSSWTLVVFRNKDNLRTTFSEIMTLCLLVFFAYLIPFLVLLVIGYFVNRMRGRAWLWPDKNRTNVYVGLMLLNIVLAGLSAVAVHYFSGLWRTFTPILISFIAVFLLVWFLKRTTEAQLDNTLIDRFTTLTRLNHRTAYVLTATLLFAIVGIIPAYACYKLAYTEEMKLFIKEGQLNLAKSMVERRERVRAQYLTTNPSGETSPIIKDFLTRRLNESTDVYDRFFFGTEQQEVTGGDKHTTTSSNRILCFFKNFVPLFNQSSIDRHALMSEAADGSWWWGQDSANDLVLHFNGASTKPQQNTERRIISKFQDLSGYRWWFIWPALLVAVSLLLAYMFRHIFLFKRDDATEDALTGFCATSASQNLFLILNRPFIGKTQFLARLGLDAKTLRRIDIEQTKDLSVCCGETDTSDTPETSGHPIILDNFDSGLEDPARNQQKLSLLERLHANKRIAIALSNLDPESFVLTNGSGQTNGGVTLSTTVLSERWTGAVSRFFKLNLEDIGNAAEFKEFLNERKNNLLSREGLSDKEQRRIVAVFKMIERECSPRACLQSIGKGIAAQAHVTTLTSAAIPRQVLIQAASYYKWIWKGCSDHEKLTLTHVAQDGLLSSNDPDAEQLMNRGLILRDPALRIMNGSFRLFVLSIGQGDADLSKCEEKARDSSNWEVLKVPLSIGVVSVILFLLLTQREIYNSALPIITALTAGVPAFFKLISLFQHDGGKAGG